MPCIIETDRLILREFTLQDTGFIINLLNSPGWLQFIGDRNIKTEEQAESYLANGPIKSYGQNGYGLWLVQLKDNSRSIGMCGIVRRDTLEHPDLGFAFLQEYTGQGFAFEAAKATMVYAKSDLAIPTLSAITLPENQRSIKLLEKLGFRYQSPITFPGTTTELLLYIH
ncbi:GNAT family N-acetyltransferase [Rufibacter roseus]|uniref:GNAT family N-acetyltransferase n=1 Tax=Rufibacter roseus TaxID=1567108 RepID=A0ABW2DKE3_9BACT|nr:GNAT family N-acetyltransferase [Rufibacter roseus]